MRHNRFSLIFTLLLLLLQLPAVAIGATATATPAPANLSWLQAQVDAGKTSVTLPSNIHVEDGEILSVSGSLEIIGNGYLLTNLTIKGGKVDFRNVTLTGIRGLDEEDGGAALTLLGEGTIAIFSLDTRATGGHSGPIGQRGGDGVRMQDDAQGLILRGSSAAVGGIGPSEGGCGVKALGCNASVFITDTASVLGQSSIFLGGSAIEVPSCGKVAMSGQSGASGGRAATDGGAGVHSLLCDRCRNRGLLSFEGDSMLIGGVASNGGAALWADRPYAPSTEQKTDILLSGEVHLYGAAGTVGGSAILATGCVIEYSGTPSLNSGNYFQTESSILELLDCEEKGEKDKVDLQAGPKLSKNPANDIAYVVNSALGQKNDRYVPTPIEDGLGTRELVTKLSGLTVERGKVTQAKVNGGGLKIKVRNVSNEFTLDFTQRLMSDGKEGVRLVLTASPTQEWLTIEATVAALQKLVSLGISQLGYTNVAPVYHERIVDIAKLLEAVEKHKESVPSVLLGTADDCVIFLLEKGDHEYQDDLMRDVLVLLEDAVPAVTATPASGG